MIWLIGNKGMLGQDLSHLLHEKNISFIGSDREVSILNQNEINDFYKINKPDMIINCSAYTAVDKAEEEKDTAYALNCTGPANIARLAADAEIPLIHISTDYVFDGTSSLPLTENAQTGPTSVYGSSKLAGENEIRRMAPMHFIVRTAWLYGQYGSNFVYTMIKLMNKLDNIKVVNDQRGSPTWTRDISGLIIKIINNKSTSWGTYHFSGEGDCTWFEFAKEIYHLAMENCLISSKCILNPCTSEEFPTPAKRPAYSLLSKEKVTEQFGYVVPQWKDSIKIFLKSLKEDDII